MSNNDFDYVWWNLKPISDKREAEYIAMKLSKMKTVCNNCVSGDCGICDIYTSTKDEARLGKYLIENYIKKGN